MRNKPRKSQQNSDAVLDIVVTTAGRFDMLRQCLDTLSSFTTIPFNVFVIDDASPAEDLRANMDIFEDKVLDFDVKHLAVSVGFPGAANEGARMGHAPLVMFLSDDVKLMDGAIDKIISDFNDEKIGIVGIKLLFPENSTSPNRPAGKVQHVGLALNVRGEPIHPLVGWSKENPKTCISRDAWAVTGACITVRRKLFEKVGGFGSMYGKGCLVKDTIVFTEDGIKYLGDLVGASSRPINKFIANIDGDFKSTLAFYNGKERVRKIELRKGYSIKGTLNHKVVVMGKDGNPIWKELLEIDNEDYVAIKYGTNMWGNNYLDRDWAYLVGLYIAEGCFDGRRITITNSDVPIIEFLQSKDFKYAGKYHYRYNKKDLGEYLQNLGIEKTQKSHTKVLSDYLLSLQRESMIWLLRGMFDGDGCSQKDGTITYSSSSLNLIKQLQMILLNFGIISCIYDKNQKGQRISYTLEILSDADKFYDMIGFNLERKQKNQENFYVGCRNILPYQRPYIKRLSQYKKISYGSLDRQFADNDDSQNIREGRLIKFLENNSDLDDKKEYKHLLDIINYGKGCVWLKVKSIEDFDELEETFDLHVPLVHNYIANGLIVHNTFEDCDLCLSVRQLGSRVFFDAEAQGYHYVGATMEKKNEGFDLQGNYMKFRTKWATSGLFSWEEWRWW